MPRSRSSYIESSSCGRWSRGSTAPVSSRMRSASVDFLWSMWVMIEKLRMLAVGAATANEYASGSAACPQQVVHLLLLAHDHVLQAVLHRLGGGLAAGGLDGRLHCLERLPLAVD